MYIWTVQPLSLSLFLFLFSLLLPLCRKVTSLHTVYGHLNWTIKDQRQGTPLADLIIDGTQTKPSMNPIVSGSENLMAYLLTRCLAELLFIISHQNHTFRVTSKSVMASNTAWTLPILTTYSTASLVQHQKHC